MLYHVNPSTGEPGRCSAKVQCRFGDSDSHYPDESAAREAFENSQSLDDVLKGARSVETDPYAEMKSASSEAMSAFSEPVKIESRENLHTVRFENGRAFTKYFNAGLNEHEELPLGNLTKDYDTVVRLLTSDPDLDFINGDCGDLAWDLYDNSEDVEMVAQLWVKGDIQSMHSIAKLKDGTYVDVLGQWSEEELLRAWKDLVNDDVEMRFGNPKPMRNPNGGLFETTKILKNYISSSR